MFSDNKKYTDPLILNLNLNCTKNGIDIFSSNLIDFVTLIITKLGIVCQNLICILLCYIL